MTFLQIKQKKNGRLTRIVKPLLVKIRFLEKDKKRFLFHISLFSQILKKKYFEKTTQTSITKIVLYLLYSKNN